jgi:hypothetical protein
MRRASATMRASPRLHERLRRKLVSNDMRIASGIGMVYGAPPVVLSSRWITSVSPRSVWRPPSSAKPSSCRAAEPNAEAIRPPSDRSAPTPRSRVVSRTSRFMDTARVRVPPSSRQFSNAISYAVR